MKAPPPVAKQPPLELLIDYNNKLHRLVIAQLDSLDALVQEIKSLLKIRTEEKIRVKFLEEKSASFVLLEKLEQLPASNRLLKVFGTLSILSNTS